VAERYQTPEAGDAAEPEGAKENAYKTA